MRKSGGRKCLARLHRRWESNPPQRRRLPVLARGFNPARAMWDGSRGSHIIFEQQCLLFGFQRSCRYNCSSSIRSEKKWQFIAGLSRATPWTKHAWSFASFNASGRQMSSASYAGAKQALLFRTSPKPLEFAFNSVMASAGSDARCDVIG